MFKKNFICRNFFPFKMVIVNFIKIFCFQPHLLIFYKWSFNCGYSSKYTHIKKKNLSPLNNIHSFYGTYLFDQGSGSGPCMQTCPLTYWANSTSKSCQACHCSCSSCNGPLASNCLSCYASSHFTGSNANDCVITNISGSSKNLTLNSSVQTYLTPYYSCLPSCPSQFYSDNSTLLCLPCSSVCLQCITISTNCTQCQFGYLLNIRHYAYTCHP